MTDVVETGTQALQASQVAAWGSDNNLGTEDYKLSKILLMHGQSKLVQDGNAKKGEWRDNVTGDLIGEAGADLEFVPFHLEKRWEVLNETGKKWLGDELFTQQNAERPVTTSLKNMNPVDGKTYWVVFRAYALRLDQLKAGVVKPYIIDFKKSARESGRRIGQWMYQDARLEKVSPAAYSWILSVGAATNKDGEQFNFIETKRGERVSVELEAQAFKMYEVLQSAGMDTTAANKGDEVETNHVPENVEF